ncbi:gluconokinase [Sphingomonas sp. VNH70]|uniref:gluconokinase n=1 Tax=Sphingomonas silueang TaxID=3156617 RepID=UPI0032B4FC26
MPRVPNRAAAKPLAIIVMGVSGSGKTTLGRSLSQVLDCRYLEGDAFHSADSIAKMAAGVALTDADRWPWLDRLGAALGDAARGGSVAVAACSALRRTYRDRLRGATGCDTAFVHLAVDRAELARRMCSRPGHYMPVSLLDSQLALFEPLGTDELASSFGAGEDDGRVMERVVAWLRAARPD